MHTNNELDDFEAKIKEKINFQNILNKNFKKNENTPVSDLIKSTTQMVVEEEYLAPKVKNSEIENKIDRLESLIHSIIINQNNLQLALPHIEQKPKKFSSKSIVLLAGVLCFSMATFYIGTKINTPALEDTSTNNPIAAIINENFVITMKFANLREVPSTKAIIQRVIQPNSKLKVLETKNNWKRVEYKDFIQNKTVTGWIYSDTLKQL